MVDIWDLHSCCRNHSDTRQRWTRRTDCFGRFVGFRLTIAYSHHSQSLLMCWADIQAWCPGKTILPETNLWLKDFAPMHQSDGVRAAIQGLAGLYVYDYTPSVEVERRVIWKLGEAESCYSSLLANPTTAESKESSSEAIALAVILSMQDVSGTVILVLECWSAFNPLRRFRLCLRSVGLKGRANRAGSWASNRQSSSLRR